jgi:hypothetical protein
MDSKRKASRHVNLHCAEMSSFLDENNYLKMTTFQNMAQKILTSEDPKFEIRTP